MNKILTIFLSMLLCVCLYGCSSGSPANNKNFSNDIPEFHIPDSIDINKTAYLFINESKYDFGTVKIKKTPEIIIEFEFENKGGIPLIILKTDVSCGCLSTEYPKGPILFGEKGIIKVRINTKNQEGSFNKTVYVKSNATNDVELLRIVGQIK